ncbi:GNAT family N-acetyltransferase [Candidatus Saccharibacteria bacterium]|nr:GNAT family N-acetyltransferase [Candidatus Saccharibacteria bacterium]
MLRERESSSTILGFITFGKEHDEYFDTLITDFGVLKEILVTEKARSRGIGRKLIKEAESVFKDSGLENIMIQCSAFNPRTLRIYEEAGYTTRQNLLYKKI